MESAEYFRHQAAICLRIAAAINDGEVAVALAATADNFANKADEIDPSLWSKHRKSERTRFSRMLASVIGAPW
jgi:hypothetical protein